MMTALRKLFSAVFGSKLKILIMIVSTVVFLFVLFPINDLGDFVSTQVARLTNNKVFLQFDELKMSLLPAPGVKVEQVFVEAQGVPGVSMKEIRFAPAIMGLISQKPYGTVNAMGLFKGDVQISVKSGARSEGGIERQRVEITAQKLSLQDLREVARLPVMFKGNLDITSTALVDLTFTEQPDVDVNLNISQFELPPSNVNTPMGPLTMPDLKLTSVDIKGRLAGGRLIIEQGQIGRENDELRGTITGNLDLSLNNQGGVINPVIGGYSFNVDLRMKRNFLDRASTFLILVDQYKTVTAEGATYKFKISAANTMMPPSIGAAR